MQFKRTPKVHTMLVPVLVLLLALGAIESIIQLQAQSRDSADAQLKLARVENTLNALQVVPFRASSALGGSPANARNQLDDGNREIDRTIRELSDDSAPAELRRLPVGLRSNYATLEHLGNVAELAEAVSRRAGLPEIDVQRIRIAAELHDVGKVAIPDAILNKPGPLTGDETAERRDAALADVAITV